MTLQELRDYIRTQLDMDEEELPNALLDSYLSEGFIRMISMERRWPFYETDWTVAKLPGDPVVPLPADCDPVGIDSVVDTASRTRLMQIGNEMAQDKFGGEGSTGTPYYYSIHNTHLHLWPQAPPDASFGYLVMGHRHPLPWITSGSSSEVDADQRLHVLLAHFAIALAYAQQEDEVLESTYMQRFQAGYLAAHNAICGPRHHRPLVFNVGTPYVPGYQPVKWNLPVS